MWLHPDQKEQLCTEQRGAEVHVGVGAHVPEGAQAGVGEAGGHQAEEGEGHAQDPNDSQVEFVFVGKLQ